MLHACFVSKLGNLLAVLCCLSSCVVSGVICSSLLCPSMAEPTPLSAPRLGTYNGKMHRPHHWSITNTAAIHSPAYLNINTTCIQHSTAKFICKGSKQSVASSPIMASTFALLYSDALKELNTIEAAKIKLLRDLAKENPTEASNVVQAIAKHAFTCPLHQRVPVMYLIDLMLKSVPICQPLLQEVIVPVFTHVWDNTPAPDLRHKLVKAASTWGPHLSEDQMAAVTAKMQPVPQQQSLLQPVSQARQSVSTVLHPPPAISMPGGMPQHMMLGASGQPLVLQLPGAPALPLPALAPGNVQPPMPILLPQTTAPFQFPLSLTGAQLQGAVPGSADPLASLSANPALLATFNQQLAARGLPPFVLPAPATTVQQPISSSGGGSTRDTATTQEPVKAAVEALFTASAKTRGKFMDLQFARNRRFQTSTHSVRPWFVKTDQWLEGTRNVEETPAVFFDEADQAAQASQAAELAPVEEDASQPTCAISGEAFERTYDPDTDKWYYEDAVVLTGDQAAAFGVMDGSIVKVHCLAGVSASSKTSKTAAGSNGQAQQASVAGPAVSSQATTSLIPKVTNATSITKFKVEDQVDSQILGSDNSQRKKRNSDEQQIAGNFSGMANSNGCAPFSASMSTTSSHMPEPKRIKVE